MAAYSTVRVKSQTLSGTTVDTVTLTGRPGNVEVYNRSGTADISFTVDGATPTALGDDCFVVAPGQALTVSAGVLGREASGVVKLIGNGNGYTVTGV